MAIDEEALPDGGNLFLCVVLSAIGSASYILGIMALAYPAFLVKTKRNGEPYSSLVEYGFLGLYVVGQSGALVLPLVASWYGPVAIALPVYQATMLMWNMIVMSMLDMQSFTKSEMTGTLVLVVSSFMLLEAGPTASDRRDAESYDKVGTAGPLLWILAQGCAPAVLLRLAEVAPPGLGYPERGHAPRHVD